MDHQPSELRIWPPGELSLKKRKFLSLKKRPLRGSFLFLIFTLVVQRPFVVRPIGKARCAKGKAPGRRRCPCIVEARQRRHWCSPPAMGRRKVTLYYEPGLFINCRNGSKSASKAQNQALKAMKRIVEPWEPGEFGADEPSHSSSRLKTPMDLRLPSCHRQE